MKWQKLVAAFWVVDFSTKGGAKSSKGKQSVSERADFEESRVGRPNSLDSEALERLLEVYYTRPYSYRQLADMFGVSRMTVWRAVQGWCDGSI